MQDYSVHSSSTKKGDWVTTEQVKSVIDLLGILNFKVDINVFYAVFGKNMGKHLWEKFCNVNRDLLLFWGTIDDNNRALLLEYIMKKLHE